MTTPNEFENPATDRADTTSQAAAPTCCSAERQTRELRACPPALRARSARFACSSAPINARADNSRHGGAAAVARE